jgi:hypothetical protein
MTKWVLMVLGCVSFLMACEQQTITPAQIGVDISPVYVGMRSTNPSIGPIHFDLQVYNTGDQVLTISSVTARGDQHCAFIFEGTADCADPCRTPSPDRVTLGKNEAAFIRGYYQPTVAADDFIALDVASNSQRDSTLIIPICGRGVAPGTTDAGDPPTCINPPSTQANCSN